MNTLLSLESIEMYSLYLLFTLFFRKVPFDVSTVFGWWLRTFSFVLTALTFFSSLLAIVPYFGNCCKYIGAHCEHIRLIFDECDEISSTEHEFGNLNEAALNKTISEKIIKAFFLHTEILK